MSQSHERTTGQDQEYQHGHQAETTGMKTMDGEVVLENRHPGWAMWWKLFTLTGLVALAMAVSGSVVPPAVITGLVVAYVAYARSNSRYIVTDERVKANVGVVVSKSREFRISDIQGLDTNQGIIASLFDIGSINVRTADGTGITWRGVPDHEQVAHVIRQHQRQYDQTVERT